jgi:hypothetical protein
MCFLAKYNYKYTNNIYSKYFSRNSKVSDSLLWFTDNNYFIKEPFIDIFLMELNPELNYLKFITINHIKYLSEYYITEETSNRYFNNFVIKGIHGQNKNQILYTINRNNILENTILKN